ncbi:MAG: hypothetical protein DRJ56_07475 [Thermoprotei archaeon]|nr:MAG: hypothetical protein DRJ56_07475 [Thermoprotei archaeon]
MELEERPRTVGELLAGLRLAPESVVVLRNGSLVTEDEELVDGDLVEVLAACPGGIDGSVL